MVAVMSLVLALIFLVLLLPAAFGQQPVDPEAPQDPHCFFGPTEPVYFPLDGWCTEARKKIEGTIKSKPRPFREVHLPVKFELTIECSGIISKLDVKESSGSQQIDKYYLERIQKAGPFLKAPKSVLPFGTKPKQFVGVAAYRGPFFITVSGPSVKVDAPYKPAKWL